jgi:hypothetical protein
MLRSLLVAALVALSTAAYAQQAGHGHMPGMAHGVPGPAADSEGPSEPGQAAFTAIQEIVAILVAEPATDWSRVDVEALRRHLIDMDNVTLRAEVATTPSPDGMRYTVSGTGAVRESIRRMVRAHAETMSSVNGMTILAEGRGDDGHAGGSGRTAETQGAGLHRSDDARHTPPAAPSHDRQGPWSPSVAARRRHCSDG